MKARFGAVAVIALLLAAPAGAAVQTYPQALTSGFPGALTDATVQTDGKVVAVGYAYQAANSGDADMIVIRFDPATLALDPTFGTGGVARVAFDRVAGGDDYGAGVAMRPGGGIMVVGTIAVGAGTDIGAQALTGNGQPDASFGPGGQRQFDFGSADQGLAVAVDANGVVTLGGRGGTFPGAFAAVRVDSSGNPVGGFGSGGKATVAAGGSGYDEIDRLVPLGSGLIGVGTADTGSLASEIALVGIDATGFAGAPVLDVDAGGDRARAAVLVGNPPVRLVVADSAVRNLAQVAVVKAYDPVTFARIPAWGGEPFGVPSAMGGLAVVGTQQLDAAGFGPRGGAGDDLLKIALDAAGGQTVGAETNFTQTPAVEDQAGAAVASSSGTVVVGSTGDVPASARDAAVTPTPSADVRMLSLFPLDVAEGGKRTLVMTAHNNGPDPANGVTIALTVPSLLTPGALPVGCSVAGAVLRCRDATALASGAEYEAAVPVVAGSIGDAESKTVTVDPIVSSDSPPDPVAYNNLGIGSVTIYDPLAQIAEAKAHAKGHVSLFGKARPRAGQRAATDPKAAITKVEVALALRRGTGCRWLRTPRGATRAGSCRRPVWLRARGVARWRFAARHVPPGRWTAYARATNVAGVVTVDFSAKRHNRVFLRVKSRR